MAFIMNELGSNVPCVKIVEFLFVQKYPLCVGKKGKSACGKKKRSRPWE
jgi:hypothetical protein